MQTKCFSWVEFKQGDWGKKVKLDAALRHVVDVGFHIVSPANGSSFNIVAIGKYSAGYAAYQNFLNESKDNRMSAWDYLNPDVSYANYVDDRDGQVYKVVVIGEQTWMAENLNYAAEGSTCNSNCNVYGRLYKPALASTLDKANDLCPSGWRLPTEEDYLILTDENNQLLGGAIDGNAVLLKATSGWKEAGSGTNAYGFSAIAANGIQETFLGKHKNDNGSGYVYNVFMILTYKSVDASVGHGGSIADGVGYPIRCIMDDNLLMDPRDGLFYKTVKIGEQTWMAENLNYTSTWVKGVCAEDDDKCEKGRYYTWLEAINETDERCGMVSACVITTSNDYDDSNVQGLCPDGWRLPSEADFEELIAQLETYDAAPLRSVEGWSVLAMERIH